MIIGKNFEGVAPKPPEEPLGNAVSTVRKLRARRDKRIVYNRKNIKDNIDNINNTNYTGKFNTIKRLIPGPQKVYKYPSFTYTGEIKNGKPHGKGYAKFHEEWEGETYEGEFKDGKIEGEGIYINNLSQNSGSVKTTYKGTFKDNLYHGRGKLTHNAGPTDFVYEGEFKNGQPHGIGTYIFVTAMQKNAGIL